MVFCQGFVRPCLKLDAACWAQFYNFYFPWKVLVNLKVFSRNIEKPDDDDTDKTDQQDRGVMS